jgi:hypothetical protein
MRASFVILQQQDETLVSIVREESCLLTRTRSRVTMPLQQHKPVRKKTTNSNSGRRWKDLYRQPLLMLMLVACRRKTQQ